MSVANRLRWAKQILVYTLLRAEHKIQSDEGVPRLPLNRVPKMLGMLRSTWCPEAFLISFKLETDDAILLQKARGSLERYGMNMVIANLLANYKQAVSFVQDHAVTIVRYGLIALFSYTIHSIGFERELWHMYAGQQTH